MTQLKGYKCENFFSRFKRKSDEGHVIDVGESSKSSFAVWNVLARKKFSKNFRRKSRVVIKCQFELVNDARGASLTYGEVGV